MDWITLALSFGKELLEKLPDYDQKKRNDFYKKTNLFNEEKVKDYPDRDDDLLLSLKEDLHAHLIAFKKEIEK